MSGFDIKVKDKRQKTKAGVMYFTNALVANKLIGNQSNLDTGLKFRCLILSEKNNNTQY